MILATGYERQLHRQLLEPLAEYLGDHEIGRDYRLQTDERCKVAIYAQGFSQASHGLSDTLLSVLAGTCRGNLRLPVPAPEARRSGPRPARARPGQLIGATPPRPSVARFPARMPGTQGVFVRVPAVPATTLQRNDIDGDAYRTDRPGRHAVGSMMPVQADMPRPTGLAADIRWTAYGVPHIRPRDERGLGYGIGYAYARDNACLLAEEIVTARGERARYFGSEGQSRRPSWTTLPSDIYAWLQPARGAANLLAGADARGTPVARRLRRRFQPPSARPTPRPPVALASPWLRAIATDDLLRLDPALLVEGGVGQFADALVVAAPPERRRSP